MVDYRFKPRRDRDDCGWHNRGYLPHFDSPEQPQFLTFRLFDSMPHEVLDRWRREVTNDIQFRNKVEKYLDAGYGSCWLRRFDVATMISNSLKFHHGRKYDLESLVIMPNHVHLLLTPIEGFHLDEIEHSIKSYTANEANKLLGRRGQFWAIESFDRYIRDWRHYCAVIRYIEDNPVKARLCREPQDWLFSSANARWQDVN
jgi:putative DNA methylase